MSIPRNLSFLAENASSTGVLSIVGGGTGTATPALVAGTNVSITGTWPNQTINSSNTGGTVTSVGGTGTVNGLSLTGAVTTSGNLTLSGTLDLSSPPAIGGTSAAAVSATTLTTSSTVTHNGGTANGVAYLNGSKVLTTGSALTFDGTNFATTGTATAAKLIPTGTSATGNGLYLPAANSVGISTNGANAVYIDSIQKIGFGVSSISTNFRSQFLGTAGSNTSAASSGTTQAASAILRLQAGGGFTAALDIGQGGGTGSWLQSCDTADLSINYPLLLNPVGGNVGIGTSLPSYKLSVNSSVGINSYDGVSGKGRFVLGDPLDNTGYVGMYRSLASTIGTAGNDLTLGALATIAFTTGAVGFASQTERMRIDSSGGLILAGSTAQKATGTTWSNPSDQRLKDNIRDYAKGITELMQVRVREWEYNGKGGTVEGTKGLGVVADEIMVVLPDTVENYEAKLNTDDEEVTAIKKFDATEITWLLVKTVQEQQALITTLTARIEALEAK